MKEIRDEFEAGRRAGIEEALKCVFSSTGALEVYDAIRALLDAPKKEVSRLCAHGWFSCSECRWVGGLPEKTP